MKTRVITLSAISSALCALTLVLGTYFAELFDLFAVMFGPLFLSLPLFLDSPKGSFLAYLSAGILALLLTGFNITNLVYVSYFPFFGIYPIVKYISVMKKWKKPIFYTMSCLWFILTVVGMYYYYTAFLGLDLGLIIKIKQEYIPILLAIGSAPIFFLIDKFVFVAQIMIFRLLKKIIKIQK